MEKVTKPIVLNETFSEKLTTTNDFLSSIAQSCETISAHGPKVTTGTSADGSTTITVENKDGTITTKLVDGTARASVNTLSARMDTFTSLPEGSTSGNAELADIRVGAYGTTYDTAGNAVRGQIGELKSDLSNIIRDSNNLVKSENIQANIAVSGSVSVGNTLPLNSNTQYSTVRGIRVESGKSYTINNSRIIAIVDSNDTVVYKDATDYSLPREIVPTESGELVVTAYNTFINSLYVVEANHYPEERDKKYPTEWLSDVVDNSIADMSFITNAMARVPKNLVKDSNITEKTAIDAIPVGSTIAISTNDSYDLVRGVKAISGQTYIINGSRLMQIIDTDGVVVEAHNVDERSPYEYTPQVNGEFILCYFRSLSRGSYYINLKEDGIGYEDPNHPQAKEWLLNLIKDKANVLNGKTIYNFGDSCSQGSGTFDDKGPAELVADVCGMKCTDFAVGGASIVKYTDDSRSCVVDQMQNAPSTKPDFVLLAGGINDLKFTTAGTAPSQPTSANDYSESYINGLDITKFSGAFERAIYIALNKWTGTQLIYMFEHKMWGHFNDGTQSVHDVALAICKKWNIPVLDMWDEGGLNLAIKSQLIKYGSQTTGTGITIDGVTYDGTHPNHEGVMAYYVPKLKAKLIECCPI